MAIETFHARVDLPTAREEVDEVVEPLLEPARHHRVTRVVFVVYADDGPARCRALRAAAARRLRASRHRRGRGLRADERRGGSRPAGPGRRARGVPYDVGGHPFRAQAVVDGIVVHGSRDELAARAAARAPTRSTDGRALAGCAGDGCRASPTARSRDLVDAARSSRDRSDDRRARPGAARDARDPGPRRRVGRRCPATCAASTSGSGPTSSSAPPTPLVAAPAAVLGAAPPGWPGHGALAWCAVDRCPSRRSRLLAGRPGRPTLLTRRGAAVTRGQGGVDWTERADRVAVGYRPPHGHPDASGSRRSCWSSTRRREAVTSRAREVLKEFREHGRGDGVRSRDRRARPGAVPPPARDPDRPDPRRRRRRSTQVVGGRRTAGEAAPSRGPGAWPPAPSSPLGGDEPVVTDDDRYRDMVETFGEVARTRRHLRDARPRRDRLRRGGRRAASTGSRPGCRSCWRSAPTRPSPTARDTGYASWRDPAVVDAGRAPARPSRSARVAGYRRRVRADDRRAARPATRGCSTSTPGSRSGQPTLEVRILRRVHRPRRTSGCSRRWCGPWSRPRPTTGAGATVPALAGRGAAGRPVAGVALRAGRHAGRPGHATSCARPARCSTRWSSWSAGRLAAAGDADRVAPGVERVLGATGATRQRAAYERTGSLAGRRRRPDRPH